MPKSTPDEPLFVDGCPFCDIFKKHKHPKKLYYLTNEFILCEWDGTPMIITSDHVTTINRGLWGRMLHAVRKKYGEKIKLVKNNKPPYDHWHMTVTVVKD